MGLLEEADRAMVESRRVAHADGLEETALGFILFMPGLLALIGERFMRMPVPPQLVISMLSCCALLGAMIARPIIRRVRRKLSCKRGWRVTPLALEWKETLSATLMLISAGTALCLLMQAWLSMHAISMAILAGLGLAAALAYISFQVERWDSLVVAGLSGLAGFGLSATPLNLMDQIGALLILCGSAALAVGAFRQRRFVSTPIQSIGGKHE